MEFSNKVVIITGASSGVGAACALHFAKLSAKLSLVGRNQNNLKKIAEKCQLIHGFPPLSVIADVTIEEDLQRIVSETIKHYERIDVLVNNAGISKLTGIHGDMSAYDSIMSTNVRGTYLLTKMVLPYLIETKGNIVNISSILSTKAITFMTPYCMSKAALDMFTKCVALEFATKGVRVNSVNPGPVKTEIFRRAGMNEEENEKLFEGLKAAAPLKKVALGQDVAELVCFLASERAHCVTGSCYVIDCGLLLGDGGNIDRH
ncbi:3-oxoacyl-[acyl-carrier-protein] reductase FabG-like [Pectinophora gossypiella]|uniref:3-oxoacyl-[acyl-carrier-protein] reductase FabG-like n=1 Tax=Pectinophora gossypiella TaxID=13191 RepID=UPI00214E589F|nr:3-oxoacyl-[acyl-carrier-protein] reductase FabG-like [Pectinophora gossypiella]